MTQQIGLKGSILPGGESIVWVHVPNTEEWTITGATEEVLTILWIPGTIAHQVSISSTFYVQPGGRGEGGRGVTS